MSYRSWLVLAVAPIVLLACADEPSVDGNVDDRPEAPNDVGLEPEGVSTNGVSTNGVSTNGISTNGVSTNGISTNGIQINGQTLTAVSLSGAALGLVPFESVSLDATVFSGTLATGVAASGDAFVGASFVGELSNGATKKLRVDARTPLSGSSAGLSAYEVSYYTVFGVKKHLCGLDPTGAPVLAIPVQGSWNYKQGVPGGGAFTPDANRFTFACRGAAIAKCVELGYRPWQAAPGGGTLEGHLAACTRALRADYCGDGKSWTVNGTSINIYDGAGVQNDTESWGFEAEWTADGARFMNQGPAARYSLVSSVAPGCASQLAASLTVDTVASFNPSNFSTGTLLVTEYQH
jgi:ADYC domain/GLTT repeat (6 copies)